jgi:hypothetical protein
MELEEARREFGRLYEKNMFSFSSDFDGDERATAVQAAFSCKLESKNSWPLNPHLTVDGNFAITPSHRDMGILRITPAIYLSLKNLQTRLETIHSHPPEIELFPFFSLLAAGAWACQPCW